MRNGVPYRLALRSQTPELARKAVSKALSHRFTRVQFKNPSFRKKMKGKGRRSKKSKLDFKALSSSRIAQSSLKQTMRV
jgi:hypothetical protein